MMNETQSQRRALAAWPRDERTRLLSAGALGRKIRQVVVEENFSKFTPPQLKAAILKSPRFYDRLAPLAGVMIAVCEVDNNAAFLLAAEQEQLDQMATYVGSLLNAQRLRPAIGGKSTQKIIDALGLDTWRFALRHVNNAPPLMEDTRPLLEAIRSDGRRAITLWAKSKAPSMVHLFADMLQVDLTKPEPHIEAWWKWAVETVLDEIEL